MNSSPWDLQLNLLPTSRVFKSMVNGNDTVPFENIILNEYEEEWRRRRLWNHVTWLCLFSCNRVCALLCILNYITRYKRFLQFSFFACHSFHISCNKFEDISRPTIELTWRHFWKVYVSTKVYSHPTRAVYITWKWVDFRLHGTFKC